LPQFQDVLDMMAKHHGENITPEAFAAELLRLGLEDQTKREQ
jgi:hypothetical protein